MKEWNKIVGMSVAQARKYHNNIRIVKADGENTVSDCAFRPTRLNVEVAKGKIVKVISWG